MRDDKTMVYLMNWTEPESADKDGDPFITYLEYVVGGVFTPIVCILGMVGNALAVITWNRRALRSSTGRFLSAQGLADFGVLLMSIIVISARQWTSWFDHDRIYAIFFSYVGFPLYYIFVHCSVWITLGVTIERYIMVCWATQSKRFCGEKQAQIGVSLIVFLSILANIPHFFIYEAASSSSSGTDEDMSMAPKPALVKTPFGEGDGGQLYFLYISCISLIAIPWLCVLVMNFTIISKISSSNRRMMDKKTSESALKAKKAEGQITRLLLIVTFTFLLMMGLHCLIQIMALTHPQGIDPLELEAAYSIAKAGYVINSSTNFLLYCMTGRRFRRELKKLFGIELSKEDMTSTFATSTVTSSGTGPNDCSANTKQYK